MSSAVFECLAQGFERLSEWVSKWACRGQYWCRVLITDGTAYISSIFQSRQAVDQSVQDVFAVLLDQVIDVSEDSAALKSMECLALTQRWTTYHIAADRLFAPGEMGAGGRAGR